MNLFCIIPARGGSKGIPGKNIKSFCGQPLITWSIQQALNSKYVDKVYVSTDDEKIALAATVAGANVIKRPPELAHDSIAIEPGIEHALKDFPDVDTILLLQPTSPVRTPQDIDNAIDKYLQSSAVSLFSASKLDDICLWKKGNNVFESVTYNYMDRGRRQDRDPYYLENGSIYVFGRENLKFGNRLRQKIEIYEMPFWKSFELDNLEDWDLCEYFMKLKIIGNTPGKIIDDYISGNVTKILNKNKFPEYDNVYTDTFSELIDKLIIVHIRYWYLEDAMANAKTDEELVKYRKKSEALFKEKRPMLVEAIDKMFLKAIK